MKKYEITLKSGEKLSISCSNDLLAAYIAMGPHVQLLDKGGKVFGVLDLGEVALIFGKDK